MKKFLIGCFGLLGLLMLGAAVAAASISPTYEVQRTNQVSGTPEQAYAVVVNLHTWPDWTVWSQKADPSCVWDWTGPESGEGAGMSWKGDVHGQGRLTLGSCEPGKKVSYDMVFSEGNGSEISSSATLTFVPVGQKTEIVWSMSGEMSGAWKLFIPFMDAMVGPLFEEGLEGLDRYLQAGN